MIGEFGRGAAAMRVQPGKYAAARSRHCSGVSASGAGGDPVLNPTTATTRTEAVRIQRIVSTSAKTLPDTLRGQVRSWLRLSPTVPPGPPRYGRVVDHRRARTTPRRRHPHAESGGLASRAGAGFAGYGVLPSRSGLGVRGALSPNAQARPARQTPGLRPRNRPAPPAHGHPWSEGRPDALHGAPREHARSHCDGRLHAQ